MVEGRGVAAGLHRHGDDEKGQAADHEAAGQAAVTKVGQERGTGQRIDEADDEPGDEPPVQMARLEALVGDAQAENDTHRGQTGDRGEHARYPRSIARPADARRRGPVVVHVSPPSQQYDGWRTGRMVLAVPNCARPRSGHGRATT